MGKNAISLSFDKGFDLETVHSSLLQYILGAITLAIISGLFFGLVTFLLLKVSKRGSKQNG